MKQVHTVRLKLEANPFSRQRDYLDVRVMADTRDAALKQLEDVLSELCEKRITPARGGE